MQSHAYYKRPAQLFQRFNVSYNRIFIPSDSTFPKFQFTGFSQLFSLKISTASSLFLLNELSLLCFSQDTNNFKDLMGAFLAFGLFSDGGLLVATQVKLDRASLVHHHHLYEKNWWIIHIQQEEKILCLTVTFLGCFSVTPNLDKYITKSIFNLWKWFKVQFSLLHH